MPCRIPEETERRWFRNGQQSKSHDPKTPITNKTVQRVEATLGETRHVSNPPKRTTGSFRKVHMQK
eukprot:949735-Amphidinium_carterae.1